MTCSFIAIKGNHLDKASAIFSCFQYEDTGREKQFGDWDAFNAYLTDNVYNFAAEDIALRGIWNDNGWTIINDFELVDAVDEAALADLSEKLQTDVATFIVQTTSNTFAFALYSDGRVMRHFFSSGDDLTDLHPPLEQEKGLNMNEKVFSDDIIQLAERFGIDLDGKAGVTYFVKELGYSEELRNELKDVKPLPEGTKKPWWKFW
jgi:hypothetical protein